MFASKHTISKVPHSYLVQQAHQTFLNISRSEQDRNQIAYIMGALLQLGLKHIERYKLPGDAASGAEQESQAHLACIAPDFMVKQSYLLVTIAFSL